MPTLTATLASLPQSLVEKIGDELGTRDLCSLRCVATPFRYTGQLCVLVAKNMLAVEEAVEVPSTFA